MSDPWQPTTAPGTSSYTTYRDDEKKPAADGSVQSWGRSDDNPVGLVELAHNPRNNRVRDR